MEPLVGTSRIGRFTSLPAPPFDHLIEWKAILDGQVVQWSKRVEALDFAMEIFFYWDQELDAVAFTQLTSNGIHGKGVVEIEDGVISLVGFAMQTWGIAEFKQTFEIMADGTLEDRYYSWRGTGWSPEHVIVYRMSPDEARGSGFTIYSPVWSILMKSLVTARVLAAWGLPAARACCTTTAGGMI